MMCPAMAKVVEDCDVVICFGFGAPVPQVPSNVHVLNLETYADYDVETLIGLWLTVTEPVRRSQAESTLPPMPKPQNLG